MGLDRRRVRSLSLAVPRLGRRDIVGPGDNVISIAVAILAVFAAIGAGAMLLSALRVCADFALTHRIVWSFAVGIGVLGWLIFPLAAIGWLGNVPLLILLVGAALGVVKLRQPGQASARRDPLDAISWYLLAALALVSAFDAVESLAPPSDADSLAYHFALPKEFLAAGQLFFVPRAIDGAVPLLVHMTYIPVLGLGGERALTLWVLFSGWFAGGFVYVICRRFLDFNWSLGVTVIFLATPAVVYGAGSGQVEIRLALFALAAAFAVSEALATGKLRFALLAGVAAGFFAGGKYTGLLFVAASGIVILNRPGWFIRAATFSAAAVVAGFQWYLWNWLHTGDPVFPMLFTALGLPDSEIWTGAHQAWLKAEVFPSERAFSRDPLSALIYPFFATFVPAHAFEAGRTGFGPIALLAFPWAAWGAWKLRSRLRQSRLLPVAAIVAVFYFLWYFTGSSQRLRHLLPIYPLLLIAMAVAAERAWQCGLPVRPLAVGAALTIIVQLGGHALFTINSARHVVSGEDRDAYYNRTVPGHVLANWLNRHVARGDRVLHTYRQINYLLDVPYFFTSRFSVAAIDLRREADDPAALWRQLDAQGISHVVVAAPRSGAPADDTLGRLVHALTLRGCFSSLARIEWTDIQSRTLPGLARSTSDLDILKRTSETCRP